MNCLIDCAEFPFAQGFADNKIVNSKLSVGCIGLGNSLIEIPWLT